MAILKCKMCGGDIQAKDGAAYGTCESCGTTSTLPKASDERKANLYNRANHFRRQNDFDKAVQAYENILNDDNADAEAHWGVVLSRYGIEYVEDPVTHQRVPTCHRVQSESILTDADYLETLQHAPDEYTKSLYEEEAKKISEIQKGILAISNKEQPYDVFICYKETTDGGSRTKDSTIAQDIYYELTKDGYKVFFARITLEDKLGQQYEPYIFSALNSAKVMLVIGTKKEHFEAVWVKNEWSRFLAIMKKDRSRLLIPCYRDMDAYDIPDELSNLQSQDMSKVGFIQDILRGVKKILGVSKSGEKTSSAATGTAPTAPGVESLMKRGKLFLEDSDWKQANEYFDKVLDIDPEYAPAYSGKLCAELKVCQEELLGDYKEPISGLSNFQKAVRFANTDYKANLKDYDEKIKERLRQEHYDELVKAKNNASTEGEYQNIAQKFREMNGYKNTTELASECDNQYRVLKERREEQERIELERRAEQERIERERRATQEKKDREERERREAEERERQRIEEENRKVKEKAKEKRNVIISTVSLFIIAVGIVFLVIRQKNEQEKELMREFRTVSSQMLSVREGPSANYEPVDKISQNTRVEILERENDSTWVKISYRDGKTGYVDSEHLWRAPGLYAGEVYQGNRDLSGAINWIKSNVKENGNYTIVLGKFEDVNNIDLSFKDTKVNITLMVTGNDEQFVRLGSPITVGPGVTFIMERGVNLRGFDFLQRKLVTEVGGTFIMNEAKGD